MEEPVEGRYDLLALNICQHIAMHRESKWIYVNHASTMAAHDVLLRICMEGIIELEGTPKHHTRRSSDHRALIATEMRVI